MGFNLGKVAKRVQAGITTGGLSEVAGYKGGNPLDMLSPNQTTQDQVPLETPEQRAARQKLLKFADTGTFGDFTAGASLPLGYGDFNMTDQEQAGLSELQKLLASGIPEQFQLGDAALASILNPDPNYVQSQFDPFKAQVDRQIGESVNAAKRDSAYNGNLYSSSAIRNIGDVYNRGNETLTSKLAELTDSALSRRASAIPLAYQAGQAKDNLVLNRVNASQQYGGLARQLNDASIKARDAELLRRRQELGLPIDAAKTVAGNNTPFGVPSVTTQTPSTTMDLLNLLIKGGALFAGAKG